MPFSEASIAGHSVQSELWLRGSIGHWVWQYEDDYFFGAVLNKKAVLVLSRVNTETKPEVPLFVSKELQFNFNWNAVQDGNEEIREQKELDKAGTKRYWTNYLPIFW